jgi:hypothetical protein
LNGYHNQMYAHNHNYHVPNYTSDVSSGQQESYYYQSRPYQQQQQTFFYNPQTGKYYYQKSNIQQTAQYYYDQNTGKVYSNFYPYTNYQENYQEGEHEEYYEEETKSDSSVQGVIITEVSDDEDNEFKLNKDKKKDYVDAVSLKDE